MTLPRPPEMQAPPASQRRRSPRRVWVAVAVVAGLLLAGGTRLLPDSTVPADGDEAVLAELRAAKRAVADSEAEIAALTDERLTLAARNAQLEADLSALRAGARSPDFRVQFHELRTAAEAARARLVRSRLARADDTEFDFARDSLCERITAEDMNDILLVAQFESSTLLDAEPTFAPDGCERSSWRSEWGAVWVSEWWPEGDGSLLVHLGADSLGPPRPAAFDEFRSHHLLPRSVTSGNLRWRSGAEMNLRVDGHDEELFFSLGVSTDGFLNIESNDYEWLAFAIVGLLLQHVGWVR
jgi:hypothetical protein